MSGDITAAFGLFDAAAEIDQGVGAGADQAPRQAGPDTGAVDEVGEVLEVSEAVPAVDELIAVTATPAEDGRFNIRIENASGDSALATPLAPGAYTIHADGEPLFTVGESDRGEGLEGLAEDGDPWGLADALGAFDGVVGSGAFAVHPAVATRHPSSRVRRTSSRSRPSRASTCHSRRCSSSRTICSSPRSPTGSISSRTVLRSAVISPTW